jgi:limonene-1,2-epoxide hydrolase
MGRPMITALGSVMFLITSAVSIHADTGTDSIAGGAKVVKRFVESWANAPLDETVGYLAEDVHFVNVPIPEPIEGRAKAKQFLEPFFVKDSLIVPFHFQTEIKQILSDGQSVMLERVDTFKIAGKQWSIPVVGVFEVKNGKITVWKDYFDMGQFQEPATLIDVLKKKK